MPLNLASTEHALFYKQLSHLSLRCTQTAATEWNWGAPVAWFRSKAAFAPLCGPRVAEVEVFLDAPASSGAVVSVWGIYRQHKSRARNR